MALELVGGALLKAAVAELLRAVIHARKKATSIQPALTRLETTLRSITPRVNEISRLNHKLNLPNEETEELVTLLQNGQALIHKCSNISSINWVRKVQFSKELHDLDYSLLRYFQTILPLDMFRNDMEMLVMMRELHMKLVGAQDGGESSKPKDEDNDEEDEEEEDEELYQNEEQKKLFFLKTCPHNFDLDDLLSLQVIFVAYGTYGTSYSCNTEHGVILIKTLDKVKVGNMEFKQRIEDLGKVGKHPNIVAPCGYCFFESYKFLLYDYAPEGSLYAILHENRGMARLDWDCRVNICLGIARGISHLHSVKLIHGNIKSTNVLLTEDLDGCISDYGLAPIMNFPEKTLKEKGYHAPEFIQTWEATQKSDVYSFGILLLEILTEKAPGLIDHPSKVFDMKLSLYQFDVKQMVQMLDIAIQCVEEEPDRRPNMDDIVRMIDQVQ